MTDGIARGGPVPTYAPQSPVGESPAAFEGAASRVDCVAPRWKPGSRQTTPIVHEGVMYPPPPRDFPLGLRHAGLYPHPSGVRRQFSQLSGGGSASTASVTGLTAGACATAGAAKARTASMTSAAGRVIVDL